MVEVDNGAGYRVPLTCYEAADGAAVILLMPALGVAAGFYDKLAAALAARGFNVAVMEQRGQGASALRPSRHSDWGFAEVLDQDLPAVLHWLRERYPNGPLFVMGHSLGGHYAAITAGRFPERVDGVVMVATGSPWFQAFAGSMRTKVRLLSHMIPLCGLAWGYYPGERIGFGGREARTVMADWRQLALGNRYRARGLAEDLDAAIARYPGPVLAIRLADDPFAPAAAVHAVIEKFRATGPLEEVLSADLLGDRADHFRWVRQADAVAQRVSTWLGGTDGGPTGARR